MKVDFPR